MTTEKKNGPTNELGLKESLGLLLKNRYLWIIVGLVTGLAGYDGMAEVQTASANSAIIFLYNFLPMIVFWCYDYLELYV